MRVSIYLEGIDMNIIIRSILVNASRLLPDSLYLRLKFRQRMHRKLDLKNPQTFNEKLQWLKLHDRNPLYTTLVDKFEVKKYVADKIGEQYIIPTLGVWDRFEDIDFNSLPDQFVLKCTHDSGGLVICRDKANFDIEAARKKINVSLKTNYYFHGREWPYRKVARRIIAEKYMENQPANSLRDYKFFCFNGQPLYCQVISNRNANETIDFFDMQWKHQDFKGLTVPSKPFSEIPISIPKTFNEMKKAAEILAKDKSFVRADFYEVKGSMYFGELTFYPASGFGEFNPDKWNIIIGGLLQLPKKSG